MLAFNHEKYENLYLAKLSCYTVCLVKIIFYNQELLSMEMPITRDSVCMCRKVNSLWLYFVIII